MRDFSAHSTNALVCSRLQRRQQGNKAKVETTASPAQKEDTANKGDVVVTAPIVKTDKAIADVASDKDPEPVVKTDNAPAQRVATGDKAPDFELLSSKGGTLALETLLKESPVALVFYRSAVW